MHFHKFRPKSIALKNFSAAHSDFFLSHKSRSYNLRQQITKSINRAKCLKEAERQQEDSSDPRSSLRLFMTHLYPLTIRNADLRLSACNYSRLARRHAESRIPLPHVSAISPRTSAHACARIEGEIDITVYVVICVDFTRIKRRNAKSFNVAFEI